MSKYSDRVAPLRIGGVDENGRQRVACSLEAMPGFEPAAAEAASLIVDWQGIADAAGLDTLETAAFLAGWPHNAHFAARRGLRPQKLGAINRSIARKLLLARHRIGQFAFQGTPAEKKIQEFWSTAPNRRDLGCWYEGTMRPTGQFNIRVSHEVRLLASYRDRTVVGEIPYDVPSRDFGGFKIVLRPGCFREFMRTGETLACAHHDPARLLGRTKSKTLRLMDGPKQLDFVIDTPKTSYGEDLLVLIRRGDLRDVSLLFNPLEVTKSGSIREVHRAELFEIAPVTIAGFFQSHLERLQADQSQEYARNYQRGFEGAMAEIAKGVIARETPRKTVH